MVIQLNLNKETFEKLESQLKVARQVGDHRLVTRILAILSLNSGRVISEVAEVFRVSKEAVRLWFHKFLLYGVEGLKSKKSPGRKPKLTKTQKKELKQIIKDGPQKAAYPGGCWRSPMVQDVIQQKFDVFYSVFYISQLLKNLGLSFQKGKFISDHLNDEKRKEWLEKTWPEIYQKARKLKAKIMFGDEASFPQWGSLSRTWAPRGEQPVIKTSGKRKSYKVFGLTEFFTGLCYFKGHEGRLNSDSYIAFLEDVLAKIKGHVILIQDGARYHTSKALKLFFQKQIKKLTVYQLPTYSPDYNPIEKLWKKIKEKGTHMAYFPTFENLKKKVHEMMDIFQDAQKEVLPLFNFYRELNKIW